MRFGTFQTFFFEHETELIKKSFTSCALNLPVDGSQDDTIHCLKEGQPCSSGRAMLRSQLDILNEPDTNPFSDCTSSDVEEAYPPTLLVLDSDHESKDTVTLKLSELIIELSFYDFLGAQQVVVLIL